MASTAIAAARAPALPLPRGGIGGNRLLDPGLRLGSPPLLPTAGGVGLLPPLDALAFALALLLLLAFARAFALLLGCAFALLSGCAFALGALGGRPGLGGGGIASAR